ncbi:1-deoxy-D-xylulose-5-phosphate synthase [Mobilisporobacter senegalensis]|uniref:1-deoxy-D-xylulose-5-phosphate synthase n=1 Tax=Mobilisporobacter senegalensis TaxID=1329262 RepID=A0A3N1XK71_9FIRM|nr:1-deoxy-D-xylulose-5-phosphate synthase [Mobilisporobacter senegalensis]ROR27124.1 1-deoxy-D-xylulose-5-phosphate synthase [Mobilisporobacter senegalensis]
MAKELDSIEKPNDIKNIKPENYNRLAKEIRRFLIDRVSNKGGHLASNLGVVELTMALHLILDFPKDKLVWDVGHQAYTHKILTGRKEGFDSLRCFGGMSGFPKRVESDSDCFDTGHSSTSISAALGFAKARDLSGKDNKVFAVIGDGALSGGMAYEALNNAARLKSNMVIVLNDNNMSISENVGGMSTYLGKIRSNTKYLGLKEGVETTLRKLPVFGDAIVDKIRKSKDSIKRLVIPGMLFEDMGITYIGPIDGHNMEQLLSAFRSAIKMNEAVIVHVITKKGKGYSYAEKNPSKFHAMEPFVIKTGETKTESLCVSYTEAFSDSIVKIADTNEKVVAISAAMPSGTGLTKFMNYYPERFFDVGIAEEHAVTFAAGLAAEGFKPFVAIYSTFLQRAYDQILHDVCLQNLPVVFAIDRAGIVGKDGETHQGIYDLSYLSHIPNLTVIAPKNVREFDMMLQYCAIYNGPIAIRYPRGKVFEGLEEFNGPIEFGKSEMIYMDQDIVLLALGSMVEVAIDVREQLRAEGFHASLVNVRFVSPLDEDMLHELAKNHHVFITLEENVKSGGYGEKISGFLSQYNYGRIKHINISIPDRFITHGEPELLKEELGIDADSIVNRCKNEIKLEH